MESKNNLDLWNKVCTTDPKNTKRVEQGRRAYTAINPQTQIKKATSVFGAYGSTWGLKNKEESSIKLDDGQILIKLTAELYYPHGSMQESTAGYLRRKTKNGLSVDIDVFKKLSTDLLTKCLSKLGFNSDVFEGRFDDQAYIDTVDRYHSYDREIMPINTEVLAERLKATKDAQSLAVLYRSNPSYASNQECREMFAFRKKELDNA